MNIHLTAGLHALELAFAKQPPDKIQLYLATLTRKGTSPEGMKRAVEHLLEHATRFPSISEILEAAEPPEHERSRSMLRDIDGMAQMPDPATRDPNEKAGVFVSRSHQISKLDGMTYTWGDLVGHPNRTELAAAHDDPAYLTLYGCRVVTERAMKAVTELQRVGRAGTL